MSVFRFDSSAPPTPTALQAMAKRNKGKKAPQSSTLSEPTMEHENDTLMDDLLAHLDSQDATVQTESATILNEMNLNDQATQIETTEKQDAKSRFKARQVCSLFAYLSSICSCHCQ